jgi:hypothetical protein
LNDPVITGQHRENIPHNFVIMPYSPLHNSFNNTSTFIKVRIVNKKIEIQNYFRLSSH